MDNLDSVVVCTSLLYWVDIHGWKAAYCMEQVGVVENRRVVAVDTGDWSSLKVEGGFGVEIAPVQDEHLDVDSDSTRSRWEEDSRSAVALGKGVALLPLERVDSP